jgi:outer membrane protein OmpA-like peptidoglycan-associated protein
MRKLMIALAFVGFSATAMAQETEVPVKKYSVATNSFWANWFISGGADFNAAYTSEENLGNKNPFSVDRGTFGFNVAVGKWFTPGIGLRTKSQGVWTTRVIDANNHHSYNYFNLHEDVMFNLSNMLFGYNEKRVWNFIPYVGLGWVRNMNYNVNDISYNFGLLNNFRISKRFNIFLDVYCAAFDGKVSDNADNTVDNICDPYGRYLKEHIRFWDKLVGASVGVTYNLGKCNWEKTPDVAALMAMNKEQMDALNASLKEQQDENARLREMLANQPKPETKIIEKTVEVVATAQSVFFNIGSSRIASRKDLVNVKEVAEYAKANGKTIVVTGYADSKTGSASFNQKLSEKRANAVAEELVKMGVDRNNIVVEAKGGVDMIAPFSYNRRVTVKVQ